MALDTVDKIAAALATNNSPFIVDKASMANAVANSLHSLWRATGQPGQGAIPTTAALCTNATAGGIAFTQQTSPASSYFGYISLINSNNSGMSFLMRDRIAHSGGGNLTLLTAQTNIAVDLVALAPPAARLGAANYSDVEWFLENYTDGGATASNATVSVTYNDGTTANLNAIPVGGTLRAGRVLSLTPFIPIAQQGLFIRAVNSVTLSASTGTAGNFGFTVYRHKFKLPLATINIANDRDWAQLRLAEAPNGACLTFIVQCSTTSTGAIRGEGTILHG